MPLAADSNARLTFHDSAAKSINISRAAAAVRRRRGDISGVVRLPNVPMSNGVNCVSAITSRIDSGAEWSSSATTCESDVRMFWPTSALPV